MISDAAGVIAKDFQNTFRLFAAAHQVTRGPGIVAASMRHEAWSGESTLSSNDVGLFEPARRDWALRALRAWARRPGHLSKLAQRDSKECRHDSWPAHSRRCGRTDPIARQAPTCGRRGGSLWLTSAVLVTLIFGSSVSPQEAIAGGSAPAAETPAKRVAAAQAPSPSKPEANRFSGYPAAAPMSFRQRWLADLGMAIMTGKQPGLGAAERADAIKLLGSADGVERIFLWHLLALSPRDGSAVELAKQTVTDTHGSVRWAAFQYLRSVDTPAAELLAQGQLPASDSELRYFAAEVMMQKDRRRGLALMIDLVSASMDPPLFDRLSDSIVAHGTRGELEELRRRASAVDTGAKYYGWIADRLAARLQPGAAPGR